MGGFKVVFSLVIAVAFMLGFLSIPNFDSLLGSCSETILCGKNITDLLNFFNKTDSAAIAFGNYYFNKITTGAVVFFITLVFTVFAHKTYVKFRGYKNEEEENV